MNNGVYILLGVLLTLAVLAILMPVYRRRRDDRPVYGPYYAHGGQGYRPGILYANN